MIDQPRIVASRLAGNFAKEGPCSEYIIPQVLNLAIGTPTKCPTFHGVTTMVPFGPQCWRGADLVQTCDPTKSVRMEAQFRSPTGGPIEETMLLRILVNNEIKYGPAPVADLEITDGKFIRAWRILSSVEFNNLGLAPGCVGTLCRFDITWGD